MLSLLDHGANVTIIDNLDNAFEVAFERMKKLAGSKAGNMKFIKVGWPTGVLPCCLQCTQGSRLACAG